MKNYLLAGVGGQGTVLASRILAYCAMARGETAHTAETIGMAQRGGGVVSHVRIGDGEAAPLIPPGNADAILGFEPGETVRALPYLKKGGTVVVCTTPIRPVTDTLSGGVYDGDAMIAYLKRCDCHLILVDGGELLARCGTQKVLNVALLGAADDADAIDFTKDELRAALKEMVPEKFLALNLKALEG